MDINYFEINLGIPTYRGDANSIWSNHILDMGTRKMFQRDELHWYNSFWLTTHHKREYFVAKPNEGHLAIARLSKLCNLRCITQNIDHLHSKTSLSPSHIIEVHGRLGLYKCINSRKKNPCPYAKTHSIDTVQLEKHSNDYHQNKPTFTIKSVPKCPFCKTLLLPQALLFDEKYESHDFYQWRKALQWIADCEVICFVGTSFSVGVTAECLSIAKDNDKTLYNFNIRVDKEVKNLPGMYHIVGKSEISLPFLFNTLVEIGKSQHLSHKPRMHFYSSQYSSTHKVVKRSNLKRLQRNSKVIHSDDEQQQPVEEHEYDSDHERISKKIKFKEYSSSDDGASSSEEGETEEEFDDSDEDY